MILDIVSLPADAVEVGVIGQVWGVQGWFKVHPHSATAAALFSSKQWYLQAAQAKKRGLARPLVQAQASRKPKGQTLAPDRVNLPEEASQQGALLRIAHVKTHSDILVAQARDMSDREQAQTLQGARIFIPRASFPTLPDDEYYWVDLLGLRVLNREGLDLGQVSDLFSAGPQVTLVVEGGVATEQAATQRLIPFVSAYVDQVDLQQKTILVDWQPDY